MIYPSIEDINNYGIVYTPHNLVDKVLDLIPEKYFKNPQFTWLDIGAGNGAFSINLYNRLYKNLSEKIKDDGMRKNHILKNMLYMIEIYEPHIKYLEILFSREANIIDIDFFSELIKVKNTITNHNNKNILIPNFNFIIGNPPYNISGAIKTPTNSKIKKTDDGKAIYVNFINKSLDLLCKGGFLNFIIPSLWLKPDKAGLYKKLTNLKIHKLNCLSTTETYRLFNYKAQTPTCYFFIENNNSDSANNLIKIYDKIEETYIDYILKFNYPIPTLGISVINQFLKIVERTECIKIYKTSTPSKKTILRETSNEEEKFDGNISILLNYKNIQTCIFDNNKQKSSVDQISSPKFVYNYSNIPQQYYGIPKLILAHKMYGMPYLDLSGEYGISSRDNYVITLNDYSLDELRQFQYFLSTKTALFIYASSCYRMRYLERYAYTFIPNINKLNDFPSLINVKSREKRDKIIGKYFNLTEKQIFIIETSFKNYEFFV